MVIASHEFHKMVVSWFSDIIVRWISFVLFTGHRCVRPQWRTPAVPNVLAVCERNIFVILNSKNFLTITKYKKFKFKIHQLNTYSCIWSFWSMAKTSEIYNLNIFLTTCTTFLSWPTHVRFLDNLTRLNYNNI